MGREQQCVACLLQVRKEPGGLCRGTSAVSPPAPALGQPWCVWAGARVRQLHVHLAGASAPRSATQPLTRTASPRCRARAARRRGPKPPQRHEPALRQKVRQERRPRRVLAPRRLGKPTGKRGQPQQAHRRLCEKRTPRSRRITTHKPTDHPAAHPPTPDTWFSARARLD